MIPAAQAVESLIREYGGLVFHTIYGFTGDWQESEDLTQETFLQALMAIDAARMASGAHFHAKAWLLRIAVNIVRMRRRRQTLYCFIPFSQMREERQEETDAEVVSERALPVQPVGYGTVEAGDPAEIVAERDAIHRTMALLPEALRMCLLLSVVGGFSSGEIATMLNLNEVAVRQRLSRARKQFQQIYMQVSSGAVIGSIVSALDGKSMSSDANKHRTGKDRVLRRKVATPPHYLPLTSAS